MNAGAAMRRLSRWCVAASLLTGCAAPLSEFYPDSFFSQDGVYENRPLGFSLTFRGNWIIETDPGAMTGATREFARELQQQGAELLFAGATAEGTQGVRGIAVNLNMPAMEYATRIRAINADAVSADSGLSEVRTERAQLIKWEYAIGEYRFIEFFFTVDTYDIRIAFWTKPAIFERFEPVYYDIISSLTPIGRL
jgi:hypothetical protein